MLLLGKDMFLTDGNLQAKVIPAPKVHPPKDMHNDLRPISLTPTATVVVHRQPSPSAIHRRPPRRPQPHPNHPPPSLFTDIVCHICVLYPEGWSLKISSNICLGPVAPPFPNADTQFQGYPSSSDQNHTNILIGSRPLSHCQLSPFIISYFRAFAFYTCPQNADTLN